MTPAENLPLTVQNRFLEALVEASSITVTRIRSQSQTMVDQVDVDEATTIEASRGSLTPLQTEEVPPVEETSLQETYPVPQLLQGGAEMNRVVTTTM